MSRPCTLRDGCGVVAADSSLMPSMPAAGQTQVAQPARRALLLEYCQVVLDELLQRNRVAPDQLLKRPGRMIEPDLGNLLE